MSGIARPSIARPKGAREKRIRPACSVGSHDVDDEMDDRFDSPPPTVDVAAIFALMRKDIQQNITAGFAFMENKFNKPFEVGLLQFRSMAQAHL